MMCSRISSYFVALAILLVGLSPVALADRSGPKLVLPETSYDFGTISQGQQVIHDFELRNAGGSDLIIQKVAPSCGCTVSTLSSSTIKPGASEKIHVVFDTAGFLGSKNKIITIVSNSSDSSNLAVRLTGRVVSGVSITPDRVEFGEVSSASSLPTRTREFSVELDDSDSPRVSSAKSLSKYISVKKIRSEATREVFSVVLDPSAPKGDLRDRIVIEFEGGKQASINAPVTASVLGDLRITPATVSFGLINGTAPMERRLRFENNSGKRVEIERISSSDPAVSASVIDVDSGRHGVIVVTLDPTRVHGDLKANLDFKTSHPTESLLSIGVYGVEPPR